ncbi:MAG TPA: 2-oxoglutarate dehydrogenase, E2 component, dihydrolipoamide succinyltransferase, partial [Sporichthyaceae bacterium]
EISTDKVDTEIPAPSAGVLLSIDVQADQTVDVGAQLGLIGAPGAAPAAPPAPPAAAPAPPPPPAPTPPPPAAPAPAPVAAAPPPAAPPAPPAPVARPSVSNGQPDDVAGYVTPLVRKLASDNNIDLAQITGTGVGGRIRKQDVLDAARAAQDASRAVPQAPAAAPAPAPTSSAPKPSTATATESGVQPMSRLRKVIAARMVESVQVSAQLTCWVEVDVTRIARLREAAKAGFEAREGQKLSFLPFFARATVEALKVHPKVNASIDVEKGEITYHPHVHLGLAVDTERGLLVPVVHNADELNLAGLTRAMADIAGRTRNNKITPDDLGGGTFTLTNTGSRGALTDTPIINQPQVGILGTGSVVKRPVVMDDPDLGETIAIRSMVYLALTYDHRLVDGADAARFLSTVKQRLEEASFEADLGL